MIDVAYLRARYFFLGGVSRSIFSKIDKSAVEIIKDAVKSSPVDKLKRLVSAVGSNPDGEKSHRLILKDAKRSFRGSIQRYSSDYAAATILFNHLKDAHSSIVRFFYDTSNVGQFGGLRGLMFEILAKTVIATGGPFKCRKLIPDGPAEYTVSNAGATFDISFGVDNVSYLDSMEESKGLKNHLVIPRSKNFESVDSWFIDDSNLACSFQFTVSESHSITSAAYTYGKQISLKKYYTVVYDDQVFKNYRYSNIQVSKKEEHKNSKPCNIEQFVLQIPIPEKIEPGIVFDQIKNQFEAFVPKETWSPRVKMTGPLDETLVPPLNFALVAPGVYRSGYPNKRNIPFLTRLGLKTIVYLCPEEISPETQDLIKRLNIQYHHLSMQGNKEPFTQMDQQTILKAIEIILNTDNHPVLVHCNKGKHRVGCVMGIIRKLQNWSTTAIFDEYRRFSGTKARIADQEFIEIFNGPVRYLEEKKPSWL